MESINLIITKALPLFFLLDPFGVVGIVSALIKPYSQKKQAQILRREVFLSLVIMLFFFGFGSVFLNILDVSTEAVQITGGIIFFLFALNLLFPGQSALQLSSINEPFLVPIATPLIAGPSCLATIMLYAHDETATPIVISSIVLAWAVSGVIIILAPKIVRLVGDTGIKVLEQIVGLICTMIAIEMILVGIQGFLHV
ncbi:MAG: MarC family protein [Myxococcota bacterium]